MKNTLPHIVNYEKKNCEKENKLKVRHDVRQRRKNRGIS